MKLEKAMELYQTAYKWAEYHHENQVYAGKPYFHAHVLPVANLANDIASEAGMCEADVCLASTVGLLHDIVEDTDVTVTEIAQTFGRRVAQAVINLTKTKDEPLESYVARCRRDELSLIVKKADATFNLRQSVINNRKNLVQKYILTIQLLLEL